jgi:septum formation protein
MNPVQPKPIILASRSPRRIELLQQITPDFQVIPSSVEEIMQPDRTPEENAIALAQAKAEEVARQHAGHLVIGADTIVVLDGEIIGKPEDKEDAHRILKRLSGREHQVITGVAVINSRPVQAATISRVTIKSLSDETIETYIATGEPMDKAGAYAIQGKGASLVESYSGSFSNIVGLPMETLKVLLRKAGCDPKLLSQ